MIKNKYYIDKISEILSTAQAQNINPDYKLDELIEEIYWKGAKEQNTHHNEDEKNN